MVHYLLGQPVYSDYLIFARQQRLPQSFITNPQRLKRAYQAFGLPGSLGGWETLAQWPMKGGVTAFDSSGIVPAYAWFAYKVKRNSPGNHLNHHRYSAASDITCPCKLPTQPCHGMYATKKHIQLIPAAIFLSVGHQ